jgi:aryl-alcohol dehydrogenase-like predicted oxidoreductase
MVQITRMIKIGLGTVQFGLDYGISNQQGKVPQDEVYKILHTAYESGVRVLDTAAAYGTSEGVLGELMEPDWQFNIVTKIPVIGTRYSSNEIGTFIQKTFRESLQKLRKESIYSLMFHDADDLRNENADEAFDMLVSLKRDGLIKKIGVSAYSQNQLEKVRHRFEIDLVQVPFNVLDQRLAQSGYLVELHNAGIEIHTRSTFLQGLILMNPDEVKPFFNPIRPILQEFHNEAKRLETTPLRLALSYVCNFEEISNVIVGVTKASELQEILSGVTDFKRFAVINENMINPSKWK